MRADPSMIGIFSTLLDRTNWAKRRCWTVLTQSLDYVESDSKRSVNLSKPFEHIQNTPAMLRWIDKPWVCRIEERDNTIPTQSLFFFSVFGARHSSKH